MRIDKFLQIAKLIKTRSDAKKACDLGYVFLNGRRAKASLRVKPGDVIQLNLPNASIKARILALPSVKGRPARERPEDLIQILDK